MRANRLWPRQKRGGLLCLAVFGLTVWSCSSAIRCAAATAGQPATLDDLFSEGPIPRIVIEAPSKAMDRLRGRGWSWGWGGATRERPEVQVSIREGGYLYTNVAMHLKGSAGSFQPIESKPALTLHFNKYVKGQTFHGLEKLSLNNSVQDPSFASEKICRELFNAAGIPAPRADYATVELNGRKLGLYVLLEGYNRQFLKRHFKNTKGNLYDGGFLKDIDAALNTNAGENRTDQADLKALVAATRIDRDRRFARLQKILDVDRFITFMAMEVMVCHWDGYCMNKNNYRVYHDLDIDRIMFMPHGMDQVFGVMMVQASMPVGPPLQGLLARSVMDTPEGRRRYFERLAQLNRSLFDVDAITNRVNGFATRIRPILAEIGPSEAATHERELAELCDRIVQRKQSLDEQLGGVQGQVLEFDSAGTARLNGWTTSTNFGSPVLTQENDSNGNPVLRIQVGSRSSVGSWRTKVLLEEGHYSFEGKMQTKAVAADSRDMRAGAGLRVSRQPAEHKTLGDSDWTPVAFEFDVPNGIHDVDLVCELRAAAGEATFDRESLRLVRK